MILWDKFVPAGYEIDRHQQSLALFSPCRAYRPILERRLSDGEKTILWIGMNPSTADAFRNDPTVKREIDFSQRWGYNRYIKMNVCDYRSTDPKGLLEAPNGPRSPFNLSLIDTLAWAEADTIVVCHGLLPKPLRWIGTDTSNALLAKGHRLYCLGLTKDGSPKHPLYLRADTPLQQFELARASANSSGKISSIKP